MILIGWSAPFPHAAEDVNAVCVFLSVWKSPGRGQRSCFESLFWSGGKNKEKESKIRSVNQRKPEQRFSDNKRNPECGVFFNPSINCGSFLSLDYWFVYSVCFSFQIKQRGVIETCGERAEITPTPVIRRLQQQTGEPSVNTHKAVCIISRFILTLGSRGANYTVMTRQPASWLCLLKVSACLKPW